MKLPAVFDPVVVNGKELEVVNCIKLLGLTISNNLTWNAHLDEVIKKVGKRLYFLVQLRWAKVPLQDLVLFYVPCIRLVVDYEILAFYHSQPQYLKSELVHLEKRARSIIMADLNYYIALEGLGVKPMKDHHEHLCNKNGCVMLSANYGFVNIDGNVEISFDMWMTQRGCKQWNRKTIRQHRVEGQVVFPTTRYDQLY